MFSFNFRSQATKSTCDSLFIMDGDSEFYAPVDAEAEESSEPPYFMNSTGAMFISREEVCRVIGVSDQDLLGCCSNIGIPEHSRSYGHEDFEYILEYFVFRNENIDFEVLGVESSILDIGAHEWMMDQGGFNYIPEPPSGLSLLVTKVRDFFLGKKLCPIFNIKE